MSRRRYYPSQFGSDRPSRFPGFASSPMENDCPRCGEDIQDWGDACKVNGRWIHKACHGGGDE